MQSSVETLISEIDSSLSSPVLVLGALPPTGSDVDLLAHPTQGAVITSVLKRSNYTQHGHRWVKFVGNSVLSVEVLTPADLGIASDALDAAVEAGLRVRAGVANLVAPDPALKLVLLARKVVGGRRKFGVSELQKVDAALSAESSVVKKANRVADEWGCSACLEVLLQWHEGREPSLVQKVVAVTRDAMRGGAGLKGAKVAIQATVPRIGGGAVIAFSGLDGSGKSTQATLLCEFLRTVGYDATVRWSSLTYHPQGLRWFGKVVKGLASRLSLSRSNERAKELQPFLGTPERAERAGLARKAWTFMVAVGNVYSHRRMTLGSARGKVVICDRYVLDSHTNLRYLYPELGSVARQSALIGKLSKAPVKAYYLDVPGSVATARRADYTASENEKRRSFYTEAADSFGYESLDGTLPPEMLFQGIASEVWRVLPPR